MNRAELEHIIRAASGITGQPELVIVGSQAVLAQFPDAPSALLASMEADVYGLYDMAGNVWEWCWDWYSSTYYSSSPGSDPRGPASSPYGYLVLRGGSCGGDASYSRCANRYVFLPAYAFINGGFRCVRGF